MSIFDEIVCVCVFFFLYSKLGRYRNVTHLNVSDLHCFYASGKDATTIVDKLYTKFKLKIASDAE